MKQTLQIFLILTAAGAMAWAQPTQDLAPQFAQGSVAAQSAQDYFSPQLAQDYFAAQAGTTRPGAPGAPVPARAWAAGGGQTVGSIAGRLSTGMPVGRWWDNPALSDRIGLTEEQKKKMDDVFQASRIKLIDLRASLEKEEATLDPLMESATPDDSKLLPQIDRVAQARAELEKADARLLLGLRHVLSPQQWQTLQTERPIQARPAMSTRPGGDYNPPPAPSANPPARRGPGAPPSAPVTPPPGGRGNDQ